MAVKETGSFHGAAERLNLSQSAITRRIQKLEEALGSQLFERTTRSLRPALAAKRLQSRAEAIINDAQETTRAMRDESVSFAFQRGAVISLAAIPSVVGMLISPAITTFRAAGHEAHLRIIGGSANEVAEAVAAGEADFGISPMPMLEPSTDFEALYDDRIVLALALNHAFAGQGILRLEDLEDAPLIVPARGTGNRLLVDEAMFKWQPARGMCSISRGPLAFCRDLASAIVPPLFR